MSAKLSRSLVPPTGPIRWAEKYAPTEQERQLGFRPGRSLAVFDLDSATSNSNSRATRFAVVICYDLMQPQVHSALNDANVDLVVAPCLNSRPERFHSSLVSLCCNHTVAVGIANAGRNDGGFGDTCVWAPVRESWGVRILNVLKQRRPMATRIPIGSLPYTLPSGSRIRSRMTVAGRLAVRIRAKRLQPWPRRLCTYLRHL